MNLVSLDKQAKMAEETGFTTVAAQLREKAAFLRKTAVAYEHYKYVKQSDIDAFRYKLKTATTRPPTDAELLELQTGYSLAYIHAFGRISPVYDTLVFDPLDKYPGLPPVEVMQDVKQAQAHGIFDSFVVAHVRPMATKVVFPDPIIFGCINGCSDRFWIAEWGTDVKLADIIEDVR